MANINSLSGDIVTSLQQSGSQISVILPVRNGGTNLEITLNIILNSIHEKDEVLVINDNSTDGAFEFVQTVPKFADIRFLNSKGSGLVDALNTGIHESTNPWLARYDVGDFYNVERLNIQREKISPSVVAIFSDYIVEDPCGRNIGYIPSAICDPALKLSLLKSQRTPHPSVLLRKSAIIQVGSYKEDEFPAEDLGLWLRLSSIGEMVSVARPLLIYRLNPDSISAQNYQKAKSISNQLVQAEPGLKVSIQEICENAFAQRKLILASYRNLSFENERKLLFLLDLLIAIKVIPLSVSLKIRIFSSVTKRIINPKFIFPFFKLYQSKRRRDRVRLIL